jgi:hypothetical protein
MRAPTAFEIAILTRMFGQHRLQDHQSFLLLGVLPTRQREFPSSIAYRLP